MNAASPFFSKLNQPVFQLSPENDLDHRFGHIIMTADFPPLKKGD
jgi:hypothetical protein